MKKLLALGLSACLLFSFTGSAFAASTANTHAKKAAVIKKNTLHTVTNAKKKAIHTAANSKKTKNQSKKHTVITSKTKNAVHKNTTASQTQNS